MNLVVAGDYFGAHHSFEGMFKNTTVLFLYDETIPKLTKDDVILFGGGEDIFTGFYNSKPNSYSGGQRKSARDMREQALFEAGKAAGSKFLGICRGAQLLCAFAGGTLIQHVTNHAGQDHLIKTDDEQEISVSSAHHQMLNPFKVPHKLIAWAKERRSSVYLVENDTNEPLEIEPEVVWFPEIQSLAIQYHPEFMSQKSRGVEYSQELVAKYLLGE